MIDSNAMQSTVEGIDPLIRPLIPYFAELTTERIASLRAAVEQGVEAHDPIKRLAHTIKGSAASYGFPEFADIAARIEQAIAKGDIAAVATLVDRMDAMHGTLRRTIAEYPDLFKEHEDGEDEAGA